MFLGTLCILVESRLGLTMFTIHTLPGNNDINEDSISGSLKASHSSGLSMLKIQEFYIK